MNRLQKTVLVTGASRGIGKAIAVQLAKDGFDVFINYLKNDNEAKLVQTEINKIGRKAILVKGDVSSESDVTRMNKEITKHTKQLDLLINNAGMDIAKLIEEYTLDEFRKVIDINLIGVFICTKIFLPLLKKSYSAQIINISSRMGLEKTTDTVGAYGSAKAGVIKFTKCCAYEFANYRIRANAVLPGLTDTDMNRELFPEQKWWDEKAKMNPTGRVGNAQDIANVISFLASEKASYINGETIGVNGGSNLI